MGLFVNQQDRRSELQERIAAELREKAKASGLQEKASLDYNCDHGGRGCRYVFDAGAMTWKR